MTQGRPVAGHRLLGPCMAFGLIVAAACTPPDRPIQLLPSAAAALAAPDSARSLRVSEGLRYRFLWMHEGPWEIHLPDSHGCQRWWSGQGRRFWPRSTAISSRPRAGPWERISPVARCGACGLARTLAWAPGRDPWIGAVEVEDGMVHVGRAVAVGAPPKELEVIGGFPELLDGGSPPGDNEIVARSSFATTRHPRAAVAFDTDARVVWMIVVDGRQGSYSAGMTLSELTEVLLALGADEAINMDGGGSSVMVIGGRLTSRPSDAEGERRVANALAVTHDRGRCGS